MADVPLTRDLLKKYKYTKDTVSMERLVPWGNMVHSMNLANGPGKNYQKYKTLPWISHLKIFIVLKIFTNLKKTESVKN